MDNETPRPSEVKFIMTETFRRMLDAGSNQVQAAEGVKQELLALADEKEQDGHLNAADNLRMAADLLAERIKNGRLGDRVFPKM